MPCSEARINANRINAQKSTGPKTIEGKENSRRNGLKHGLTGQGIVLRPDDAAEVERRNEILQIEMAPTTLLGEILVRQIATLSHRMEQGAVHQIASVSMRVRHAGDDFDEQRIVDAERLMDVLADDPRGNLRQLKRSPEGVDLLALAWMDLRADLTDDFKPIWDRARLDRMANLLGLRAEQIKGSRLEAISKASWGVFADLVDSDGAGLVESDRIRWAQMQVIERIDQEIARLDAHLETLDFETIGRDRAEAGDRARFDSSKPATLARRYESEARRGFYKALKELREVEAQAEIPPQADTKAQVEATASVQAPGRLASSCVNAIAPSSSDIELAPPPIWPPSTTFSIARSPNGEVVSIGDPTRGPA